MVLMNGSKSARNAGSLINRNSGGGPKKQGLASTIGIPSSLISTYEKKVGYCCFSLNRNMPVGKTVSWKGTVGMAGIHRR